MINEQIIYTLWQSIRLLCNFVLIADTEDGKKDPADTVSGGAVYVLDKDSNIKYV